jgi:lysophospholipase L1-like esterase
MVLLLAEVAVRAEKSSLATPSAWPAPELQKKYDQIVARAASSQPTDVVLVGDSMMDAGGDPAALVAAGSAARIYNASVAGETLPTIAEWTTRVVVPRLHPKVVVIGFSSNELSPSVLAPATGLGAYHRSRAVRAASGTGSVVDRADAALWRWSMLYRYRSVLRHPLSLGGSSAGGGGGTQAGIFDPKLTADGQDLAFTGQHYLQGGANHARLVIGAIIATLHGFTVGDKNVAILQDLLTNLRRQGIQVLLVAMPVTADLVSFHPAGAADYQRAIASFGAIAQASGALLEVPGVWPVTEFADPVHLNGSGTVHFSKYLAPLLRKSVASGGGAGPGSAP